MPHCRKPWVRGRTSLPCWVPHGGMKEPTAEPSTEAAAVGSSRTDKETSKQQHIHRAGMAYIVH